jgi:hypothetical protein
MPSLSTNRSVSPRVTNSELPFPYEIDPGTDVVYAAVGPWTPKAVREWVQILLADPAYSPGMRGMLNLRFAAGPLPDVATTQQLAEAMAPLTSLPVRTRWAVLVGSDAMLARIRLFETFTSAGSIQFRAFTNDAEAMQWLGIESHRHPWLRRI